MSIESGAYRRMIFIVLFFGLFILVARLFYPFLTIIIWSSLIYALLAPLYERMARRPDGSERRPALRSFLAGSFALGGVVIIVVPVFFLAWSIVRQAADLAGAIIKAVETSPRLLDLSPSGPIGKFLAELTNGALDLSSLNLKSELAALLSGSANRIIGLSGAILRNAVNLVITLAFMIFTLYFLFADGSHLAKVIVGAVPIQRSYTELFLAKLKETSRQLIAGFFIVALYQAFAAFVLFFLFKVHAPLVLAALTGIASFVPMVGTGLVWLPVSLAVILSGDVTTGVALLVLCAIFVSTADNFIRPILLHERLQIHPLLIFFAIVGGLQLFGFNGLILGPLILILFFTAAALFDREAEEQSRRADAEESRRVDAEETRRGGARRGPEGGEEGGAASEEEDEQERRRGRAFLLKRRRRGKEG